MNTTVDLEGMVGQLVTLASQLMKYVPAAAMGAGMMMARQDGKVDEPEEDVNREVVVVTPPTPPSEVIATPTSVASDVSPTATASSSSMIGSPLAVPVSPSPMSEQPSSPSPMASVSESALIWEDRTPAMYGSPGGPRESVWDSPRFPEPEYKVKVASPKRKRPDHRSIEFLREEVQTGAIKRRSNLSPGERELHLAEIGVYHNVSMIKQDLSKLVKEIQDAPGKILRLQSILEHASLVLFLAEYARLVREMPR